jgi:hypothetical protein
LQRGPVQAYVLAIPEVSTETAITFEEAFTLFGCGMAAMVMPWLDETQMFIRPTDKSTLLAWVFNLGVPRDLFKGVPLPGSTDVVNALINSTTPTRAIGILGAEVYDTRRNQLDILAYQAPGQYFAYYPDSTPSSIDKRNVRHGQYTVWSPTIWMTDYDGGSPVNPEAQRVIDLILNKEVTPPTNFDTVRVVAEVGLVPECAMKVTRDFEGGELSLYDPAAPCHCAFEEVVDNTSCQACSATIPCATGVCRFGFCEEH